MRFFESKIKLLALAVVLVAAFFIMAVADRATGQERVFNALVTRVIDGDTIIARVDFGDRTAVERVRFEGIDAPEVTGDQSEAGLAAGQYLRKMIDQESVVLIVHISAGGRLRRGKYGRLIARVIWGGEDIGELLVVAGRARYY